MRDFIPQNIMGSYFGKRLATRYGLLVNTVTEFLIVALTVFVVVKIMNRIIRAREATDN